MFDLLDTSKLYYIAGPMTGYPQFNFPRFKEINDLFTAHGLRTLNPADMDIRGVKEAAMASPDGQPDENGMLGGQTWGDLLARDIKIVADVVDGVIAIDKWMASRGARLEIVVAIQCQKPLFWYRDGHLSPLQPSEALDLIRQNTVEWLKKQTA